MGGRLNERKQGWLHCFPGYSKIKLISAAGCPVVGEIEAAVAGDPLAGGEILTEGGAHAGQYESVCPEFNLFDLRGNRGSG